MGGAAGRHDSHDPVAELAVSPMRTPTREEAAMLASKVAKTPAKLAAGSNSSLTRSHWAVAAPQAQGPAGHAFLPHDAVSNQAMLRILAQRADSLTKNQAAEDRAREASGASADHAPLPQGALGNQAMLRLLAPRITGLTIHRTRDRHEQQAEYLAAEPPAASLASGKIPMFASPVQAKLTIGSTDDPLEREADRIADRISAATESAAEDKRQTGAPTNQIASAGLPKDPGLSGRAVDTARTRGIAVRRSPGPGRSQSLVAPPKVGETLTSPGQPLPDATRAMSESAFGKSFANVRVHTNTAAADSAAALHAAAYTAGNHIVFGANRFAPETSAGRHLLAHELAHVVQQAGSPAMIQRAPQHPPPPAAENGLYNDLHDEALEGLQILGVLGGALEFGLDVLMDAPLTTDEMWEMLLVRRAEPLSIPATEVNAASKNIAALDTKITDLDKQLRDKGAELRKLQEQRKSARGFPKSMIKRQIDKVQAEAEQLGTQRKKLLADRVRLRRGRALGTFGEGAPAGTGQITYAGIQVIDATGRRIAVEFAETSATQHAEERIIGRLRAALTPEQLKGARIVVVGDQEVCGARCQPALVAFAREFGVESVEAKRLVRPQIRRPERAASARTTLRTATQGTSEGLPLTEVTQLIYRAPSSSAKPGGAGPGPATAGGDVVVHVPAASRTAPSTPEPGAAGEPYFTSVRQSVRARMGSPAEVGEGAVLNLVVDLLVMKYQQWRNDVNLRERLEALQPMIDGLKAQAFQKFRSDPWYQGTYGSYYNVLLRVTATSTTAIGGGRAYVFPGSPRPEIVQVTISSENANRLISEEEGLRLFHPSEGATGAVYQNSDTQLVVYSEPLQQ
jgi:hypothetical protein